MPVERQKQCPNCGPVLARTIDPMTPGEIALLGFVTIFTCGLGLLFVIPYAIYRGMKSAGFHCPKCGQQILKEGSVKPVATSPVESRIPEQPVQRIEEKKFESLVCPTCGHIMKSTKTLGLPGSTVATCKTCANRFSLSQARGD